MAYASNSERLEFVRSVSDFNACPLVVRFEKNGRQSEIVADDVDHALALNKQWIDSGADYVEVFRVCEHDGALIATLGPYMKEAA